MNKLEATSLPSNSVHDERQLKRVRRLFQSFLALTVFTYLVSVFLGYLNNGTINLVGSATTRAIMGIGILAFGLAQGYIPHRFLSATWQMILACGIVIGGMWWVSFTFTRQIDELGRISTLITAVIGFVLITQAVPHRYILTSIGLLGLGTLILTIMDLYWSVSRPLLNETTRGAAYLVVIVAVIAMVSILLRDFQDYSLRAKLIGTTLFLTLVIVAVTTYTVGVVIRQTVVKQAEERLHVLTQTQALALGELLARQINTLQTISFNVAIQTAAAEQNNAYSDSPENIESTLLDTDFLWFRSVDNAPLLQQYMNNPLASELRKYTNTFPENAEVFFTDRYGALVATTHRTSGFYQADEAWWIEAYNSGFGSVFINTPAYDQRQILGLAIAVPIFSQPEQGQAKEVVGIMRTTYRLDALVEFLSQVDVGENNRLDLYFADGTLLRVVDGEVVFGVAPISPQESEELFPLTESVVTMDYAGVQSLVTRYPVSTLTEELFVDNLGWYMVSAQAEAVAFAPVTAQQRTNILLGVVAVMIGGAAAAFVSQILTAPIINLTEAITGVTQGNLQTRVLVRSNDEIGTLTHSFNLMTDQLSDAIANLEQRVADRTRSLNISTEVGRRLSTILDRQHLVAETVQQIRDGFSYYHAQLYLLDESGKQLLMVGGTGKAGQTMLAREHKIALEQGLVGRAAATNLPIIVPDVSQEEGWLANPLLPETKAEIAVPIAIGEEVVGVLDVQHNVVDGLQQQDADLLLSIANQVAIALQNARLLAEAQTNADRIAQITAIKEKIQNTTTIEDALQVAVRELGRSTGVPRATVHLNSNGHKEDTPTA
ncbi:MAG: GAF domain-containing protein [Chloroflexi bacterium]|nr:GAF domain-containing protein [Chloroflexota bacterium]